MSLFSDLGKLKWGDWLYTIVAAAISSAASTLLANPIASVVGALQFSPRQLVILAASSAIVAIAGVLKKSPLPDRREDIALIPGVRTRDEVTRIVKATEPGTVPTPEVAATILKG